MLGITTQPPPRSENARQTPTQVSQPQNLGAGDYADVVAMASMPEITDDCVRPGSPGNCDSNLLPPTFTTSRRWSRAARTKFEVIKYARTRTCGPVAFFSKGDQPGAQYSLARGRSSRRPTSLMSVPHAHGACQPGRTRGRTRRTCEFDRRWGSALQRATASSCSIFTTTTSPSEAPRRHAP